MSDPTPAAPSHVVLVYSDDAAVREAVRRGNAAGAMACAKFGAMQGLPTRDELERFMAVQS